MHKKHQTTMSISIQVRTRVRFQSHSYTGDMAGYLKLNRTKLQPKRAHRNFPK